ncbi:MAG: lysophospholipid acyltransferase family protein [Acidimicrobiia bacterium]
MLETVIAGARTVVLVPLFFVYTLALSLIVIVYGSFRPTSSIHDSILRHWSRLFLGIPPVRVSVEGAQHVDPEQRYVVAANHLSMFDIPLLFRVLPVKGRFLSKQEVFRVPLLGRAMRTVGIIEIDRSSGSSSRQAIVDGVQLGAERGYSFIVFPEGTRSTSGELLPFKKGAFRIAIDSGLPLLPVVIEGTDRVSRPGSKVFYPGNVVVRILEPIPTADMTNKDDLNPMVTSVESAMNAAYDDMRTPA